MEPFLSRLYDSCGLTLMGWFFGFVMGLFVARKRGYDQIKVQETIRPSNHSN
jgi:hypothetical protein